MPAVTRIIYDPDGGRIFVRETTPAIDDVLATVAWAGRWHDKAGRGWSFPRATPRFAAVLLATIANSVQDPVSVDDAVSRLAGESLATAEVMAAVRDRASAAALERPLHEVEPSYPHQVIGHHIMKTADAFLAWWGMRTGKTKFTIDAICNHGWKRVLIICPNKIVPVWAGQFKRHAAIECRVLALGETIGSVAKKHQIASAAWAMADASMSAGITDHRPLVIVVNYESVWRPPFGPTLGRGNRITDLGWALTRQWDCVVGDESHHFGKPDTRISRFMERMHFSARRRICLTGTPMSHSPLDVFGQYRFLDPTIFGAFWSPFKARYAVTKPITLNASGRSVDIITGYARTDELEEKMKTIATVVRLDDVLELPPVSDIVWPVDAGPKEAAAYKSIYKDFVAEVEGGVCSAANALGKVLRCQQVSSGFLPVQDADTGHAIETPDGERALAEFEMSKRGALQEILSDLGRDEPVAVYCRFRRDIDAVHEAAREAGRASCELSGRRNDIGDRWTPTPGQVAAVQIQSGKEGLDLSASAYAVVYSTGCPSVGAFDQLMARQSGPGQKRPVTRYHLIMKGTYDAKVYRSLRERRDIIESIMGDPRGGDDDLVD